MRENQEFRGVLAIPIDQAPQPQAAAVPRDVDLLLEAHPGGSSAVAPLGHQAGPAPDQAQDARRVEPDISGLLGVDPGGQIVSEPRRSDCGLFVPLDGYAHARADGTFTDDAAMVERIGGRVRLFEGARDNIKLTTPEDYAAAGAILARRTAAAGGV